MMCSSWFIFCYLNLIHFLPDTTDRHSSPRHMTTTIISLENSQKWLNKCDINWMRWKKRNGLANGHSWSMYFACHYFIIHKTFNDFKQQKKYSFYLCWLDSWASISSAPTTSQFFITNRTKNEALEESKKINVCQWLSHWS